MSKPDRCIPRSGTLTESYPRVSVVVPVRNRAKDIRECLESLLRLDYPSFEVIVVDDQSSDGTSKIVSRYPVKLLEGKGRGAYAARNLGFEAAKNEIVAFTDSDCIVDKEWLKNLTQCYRNSPVAGAGGRVLAFEPKGLVGIFQALGPQEVIDSAQHFELPSPDRSRFLTGLGSGNMSFRLRVLREVNGFSEDMDKCGDYELCWRIQKSGKLLVYEPMAKVYHKPRSSVTQLIIQFYQFGKSQPQLLRKRQEGYSYFELKTYLFPTREFRCRLPVQMLVTIDFFNLATVSLILALFNTSFLVLFVGLGFVCYKQAWKKTQEIRSMALRVKLLVVFPFLHALKSYAQSVGRIIGGLANGIISI